MHCVRKKVTNDTDVDLDVILEPWGMGLKLGPGETFDIVAESPNAGDLEIERGVVLLISAWAGATLKVYCNGKIVDEQVVAVPALPCGVSTREFMGLVGLDKIK